MLMLSTPDLFESERDPSVVEVPAEFHDAVDIPEFLKHPLSPENEVAAAWLRRTLQGAAVAVLVGLVCVGCVTIDLLISPSCEVPFSPPPIAGRAISLSPDPSKKRDRETHEASFATAKNPTRAIEADAGPADALARAPSPPVHGMDGAEIRFGMVAPFSGPNREYGRQLKTGVEVAFALANDAGGVNGRRLRLLVADDGDDPHRTLAAVRELYEKEDVLGFVADHGTPTTAAALPYLMEKQALLFGAFSGAPLLRRDPPDRYVFNFRPSDSEEVAAIVRYLVAVRRIAPRRIAVFAQDDSNGDAGYEAVARTLRGLPDPAPAPLRLTYPHNTADVARAVKTLAKLKNRIKAIVMVASYRATARFIEKTHDVDRGLTYASTPAVGASSLADELKLLGPSYADGVIVTQVAPEISGSSTPVLQYKAALSKYAPDETPDESSFEGYIDGLILVEALRRTGRDVNVEKLVTALEAMHDLDLGLGATLHFSANDHQASHKVWGTQLTSEGSYQLLNLE